MQYFRWSCVRLQIGSGLRAVGDWLESAGHLGKKAARTVICSCREASDATCVSRQIVRLKTFTDGGEPRSR
jgi:hypothetical protein